MGENTSLPAINEIAHFLNEFAPAEVARLSARGKDYEDLLTIGVIGGDAEKPTETEKSKALRVRTEILAAALLQAVSQVEARTAELKGTLRKARLLRFIATACASAGAMGAAATALFGKQSATIVLSLLSLASNVVSAAGTSLVLGGKKDADLIGALAALLRGKSFATLTASQIQAAQRGGFPDAEVAALLKDANAQYRELSEALAKSTA